MCNNMCEMFRVRTTGAISNSNGITLMLVHEVEGKPTGTVWETVLPICDGTNKLLLSVFNWQDGIDDVKQLCNIVLYYSCDKDELRSARKFGPSGKDIEYIDLDDEIGALYKGIREI